MKSLLLQVLSSVVIFLLSIYLQDNVLHLDITEFIGLYFVVTAYLMLGVNMVIHKVLK